MTSYGCANALCDTLNDASRCATWSRTNMSAPLRSRPKNGEMEKIGSRSCSFSDSVLQRILPCAFCHERSEYGMGLGLKRADAARLREVFEKYATVTDDGELYMKADVFVRDYLGLYREEDYNPSAVKLIAGVVDTSKDGLISFMEFQAFEALLCSPDALYRTAFQMFDTAGNGVVSFAEFADVIKKTELYQKVPFNLDSDLISLYFGKDKSRQVSFAEFSQFLHDYHEEYALQAFKRADKSGRGFISALDFQRIMVAVKSHLLTPCVKDNLVAVAGGQQVSFPFFVAFNSLLGNMELAKKVFLNATGGDKTAEISKEDFIRSAQMMSQITPLEIEILFKLVQLTQQDTRMQFADMESMTPEQYMKKISNFTLTEMKAVSSPEERGVFTAVLEGAYRFTLGAVAGSVGATAVYPIDLVKTRLQNQRSVSFIGEIMYKNSWDCFRKVVRHEGFVGLYRGLVPQLVGVAPEKAIKLTVNDFVRDRFMDPKTKKIALSAEMLAGACAGGSQVVFTNPLEIVKIRLQVAGELASTAKISAIQVVKELGFFGLYKGARACFLRDIPFSAIYFPVYAHSKKMLSDENGYNSAWTLLVAGAVGGIPAASLTTPADVIKTRLQVAARAGQTSYHGVIDAARKIMKEEGFGAFWKGAPARVFRSSPQFGVTLLTYEILQRAFYVDFGGQRPEGSEVNVSVPETPLPGKTHNPDHIGGFKAAVPIFSGIETKFGLVLPRFRKPQPEPQ